MALSTKPEKVSQYCMISSVTFKKTKTGKDYAELTLSDKTATITACKVWDVTEEVKETLMERLIIMVESIRLQSKRSLYQVEKYLFQN